MYEHLDRQFPESFFILTERDPENWWRSVERWLTTTHKHSWRKHRNYLKHLKVEKLEKTLCIDAYNTYNRDAKNYFKDRNDFLAIDFERGEGWEELCDFLGRPVPGIPFPHDNRQNYDK